MFQLGAKRLVVLGLLAGVLVGCGGGGDGGSSSSSNVNPADITTTTGGTGSGTGTDDTTSSATRFDVSKVLTNAYTTAATYNISGTVPNGTLQVTYKIEPLADVSFQGSMVKRVKTTFTPTLNGVASSSESETFLFDGSPFSFRALDWTEPNTSTTLQNRSSEVKFSSAPSSVAIGGSGDFGQRVQVINFSSSTLTWTDKYRYTVEAATSAGTAWVCVVSTLYENGVLDSEGKECFLSNANSDILGLRLEVKLFDAAGTVTNQFSLR